jgi:hypothetical protein
LLGNSLVNDFSLQRVTTIGIPLESNGAVNKLNHHYRRCFLLGPCEVVIREANSEARSSWECRDENGACTT